MLFPKFIIEGDALIIQKAAYHKDIVTDLANVKGGGWFRYSQENNTFIFNGSSEDFGKANFEDIKKCVEENKVFSGRGRRRNISDEHNFAYDTQAEIIPLGKQTSEREREPNDEDSDIRI